MTTAYTFNEKWWNEKKTEFVSGTFNINDAVRNSISGPVPSVISSKLGFFSPGSTRNAKEDRQTSSFSPKLGSQSDGDT